LTVGARGHAGDGRMFRRKLTVQARKNAEGRIELCSPGVGLWRGAPPPGTLVLPASSIGELEVLGVLHELRVDEHTHGLVLGEARRGRPARLAVEHGDVLCTLDPTVGAVVAIEEESENPWASGALLFRSPSSGRFYARPAPDHAPFVSAGQELRAGDTVCLLEIMKTFHRISYGGSDLPPHARVKAVLVAEGADLEPGDPILELEAEA
jgi:acetyl-CoA carboxylase biotin carboxyl carrier protein